MTRREVLKQAASWAAFLALARRGDAQVISANPRMRSTARSCIFFYLNGAPSHVDTFDVKDGEWNPPDARIQQFGPIAISTTLFPKLSQMTGDLCILRSVRSWEAAHERGVFYMQTAHPSNPAFVAETPNIGAVVALEKGGGGPMPPFLAPNTGGGTTMQGSTFLGGQMSPMSAPANQGGLTTIEHNFFGAQSQQRFEERFAMLQEVDGPLRDAAIDRPISNHAAYYESAKRLMYDASIASVFRFSADENNRYGNTGLGRGAIVARNAVRAKSGTAFVALSHGGWDTHQNMFDRAYAPNMYTLCGDVDTSVGNLVEDLKASGDLDQTLIVLIGEFSRTPGPLNARGGRDHHRDAMSVVMIGGGVRGGRAIGVTDSIGQNIVEPGWSQQRPIVMEDIAATVYSALGIDWTKSIEDTPSGRKFEYVPYGVQGRYTSIDEVFG
jgi:hypothetical protein